MLLLLATLALAEEPATAPVLVVLGSREAVEPFDVARQVRSVDEDPLAFDVIERLESEPGVHMQRTHRGAGSPFLRGQVGPQNLVLADGLRHNLSTFRTGPNQYLNLVEPLGDSLEVLRGPSSVLYGTGAMGGVIAVRQTAVAPGQRVLATGRVASADLGVGATIVAEQAEGDHFVRLGLSAAEHQGLRTGSGKVAPWSDFARQGWLAHAGVGLGAHTVTATTRGVRLDDAGRTDALAEGDLRRYDNTDSLSSLSWRFEQGRTTLTTRVGAHLWSETQDRTGCATEGDRLADRAGCLEETAITGKSERRDRVSAGLASTQATLDLAPLRVVVGGEGQVERVASFRRDQAPGDDWVARDRGNFSPGSSFAVGGAFAHGELDAMSVGPGLVRLRGGARLSHYRVHAEDVPLPDGDGTVDDATTGLVGSASVSWLAPGLHAWAGAYQGYRAPNLEESTLFGPEESRFSVPNNRLRPERSDTAELGLRARTPAASGSVVLWASRTADALDDAPTTWQGATETADGLAYSHRTNVPGARYLGAEGELATTVGPIQARAHVAWTRGTLDLDDGSSPARRVPPVHGGGELSLAPARQPWRLSLFAAAAAPQRRLHPGDEADLRICATAPETATTWADLGQTCPGTDGWVELGIGGTTALTEQIRAIVEVRNLTDRAYHTHGSGIDAPGIDVRAAIHATWERR
ncbi:MAG: TonB-dependent receptor [Deltaproteobacteria bacterium]|nr:MAG: TonB-dependent receptor [Deltaproteobacteria bacterium]